MMTREIEQNPNSYGVLHMEVSLGEEYNDILKGWAQENHEVNLGYIRDTQNQSHKSNEELHGW